MTSIRTVPSVLLDNRNWDTLGPIAIAAIAACTTLIGIDCETQDDARHAGLNQFMKVNEDTRKKAGNKKLVFDMRRTVMTGFSIYPEGHHQAYYINLAHKDVENRLPWVKAVKLIEAKQPGALWIAHNASYEITSFASCHEQPLDPIICTMQMSVTAFGDDNYDLRQFHMAGLGGLSQHLQPLLNGVVGTIPADLEPDEDGGQRRRFSRKVDDIIGKICAKQADSAGSYNGFVKDLAYGHGLKSLVLHFFDHKMGTFAETLGDNAHMGQLTGDEVAEYGAEDAFWCIPLFHHLMQYIATNSPDALETFFTQENPMVQVYADLWREGVKTDRPAIELRQTVERAEFARILREMKVAVRAALPFPDEPNAELMKRHQTWYFNEEKGTEGWRKYRAVIENWANSDDCEDDYEQCFQVSSPVSNAWAEERGETRKKSAFSICHYMPARVFLYDLLGSKLMFDQGKIASDGEARGKCQDWLQEQGRDATVIELMTAMTSVETRMKIYISPYLLLTDPETQRLYPVINCLLNTRRLAASVPNVMAMAKRGESTYVRGFIKPDYEDHVIVSLDWSAFELVIIGELSKDAQFHKAFGQLPHEDLHAGAASAILRAEIDWMNEDIFNSLKGFDTVGDFIDHWGVKEDQLGRLFTNLKGEPMVPGKARGYWRTEIGKGANFNYWYSGFLTTVGERMGWSMHKTGEATQAYRDRFIEAEQWRVDLIHQGQMDGYVQLPDGHRRHRFEATMAWAEAFKAKWPEISELNPIVHEITRRISRRAGNQLVNAMVQGTNAFIIKRSILRAKQRCKELGWGPREARFMLPVHDEKVWSVHKDLVPQFITMAREVMMSHDDIFPTLKLDATPAVGLTFEPWNEKKAGWGQIELFEAPKLDFLPQSAWGGRLNDNQTIEVVDYLMHTRRNAA
jgi:DNA polymerase I-like protein with 3'-5' exonuclease and polymerase domains